MSLGLLHVGNVFGCHGYYKYNCSPMYIDSITVLVITVTSKCNMVDTRHVCQWWSLAEKV
jgi:hypothetical protein